MIVQPILGLLFHVFSTPHSQLDFFVASGLVLGTVFYMSRIARTCVAYAIEDAGEEKVVYTEVDDSPTGKPTKEPYCAG